MSNSRKNVSRKNVSRKNVSRKNVSRKNRKVGGKTRKLSPALKAWNERVMTVFRRERKNDPSYRLMDAMKQAKREQ